MAWQISYVEPVLFIYTLTLYLNVPLEKQMIYGKVCLSHYNQSFCATIHAPFMNNSYEENVVQEETAQWDMYNNIVRTIPTIVSTIFLGAWSDGIGRKKVLMVPVFGETLNAIGYFLNAWFFCAPVPFMFIGSIITGICGNFPAMLMAVLAYLADVTTAETRTMRMIILDAVIFLSSIISLFTGGAMVIKYGFVSVYGLDIALNVAMIVYIFFLKESYYPTKEIEFRDVFCRYKLTEYIRLFTRKRSEYYYHIKVLLLVGCFCTLFFVTTGIDEMLILYLLHTPLNFLPTSIGYVLAAESSIKFIGALIITAVLIRRFKWHDSSLIVLCSIAAAGYSLCLGLSRIDWKVYMSTLWGLGVCAGIAACRSSLSKLVSVEEQGKLNSVVCTLQEICLLLVTIICNGIYKLTVHITPSFTLYVIAAFSLIPVLFSVMLKVYDRKAGLADKHSGIYGTLS